MTTRKLVGSMDDVKPTTNGNLVNTELYPLITEEKYGTKYSFNILRIPPNGVVREQSHKDEHAVFILWGKGKILLGHEWNDVQKGNYIYIPSELPHSFMTKDKEEMEVLILKMK